MFDFVIPPLYAGIILVALIAMGLVMSKLYRRSSKEISFVRTGFRGQKIIMNGGAFVLPVLQEAIPVNMNTLRLAVRRDNEQALITRDRMRVDVLAEFYVRVQPTTESIANAAQTLGMRTMEPERLKDLVEGKFVDALRAVAAEMAMTELHEQRVDFVQKVQQVVSEDLLKNGLELESVSLTGLDQTSREHFNPDNAFDAEGLTKLTEEIEARRKRRNEIERDTQVAIQRKNLEAEQQSLQITREQEYARLEQEREVEIRRAEQTAEVARQKAEKRREAEQAEILAAQQIDQARITAEHAVAEERVAKERAIREREIDKERAVETASVDKARAIEAANVERTKTVELAEQERAIAIAEKSREKSTAEAEADRARAIAVEAAENVVTVRETETADRQKRIALIEAARQAEKAALAVTVAAEAEKNAASDKAEAVRTLATADADKVRIGAESEADAAKLAADASAKRYSVDAEGRKGIHQADNTLSAKQIEMQVKLALLEHLPAIIRESVKPMERIDGIKIVQVDGLGGGNGAANGETTSSGSFAEQVVNSALRYRAQAPIVESLLKEIGLDGSSLAGLTDGIASTPEPASTEPEVTTEAS